ncbi:MAG: hypothetical protein AAF216_00330 [Pseudomonadota bacterium]
MSPILIGTLAVLAVGIVAATWKAPRLTSVLVWALVATIFSSSALVLALPGKFSENALFVTVAVPFIWACYQFWCYWDASKWRVAGGLIAISIVGGVVIYLIEPPV